MMCKKVHSSLSHGKRILPVLYLAVLLSAPFFGCSDESASSPLECKESGQTICVGKQFRVCDGRQWGDFQDCPNGQSCKDHTSCAEEVPPGDPKAGDPCNPESWTAVCDKTDSRARLVCGSNGILEASPCSVAGQSCHDGTCACEVGLEVCGDTCTDVMTSTEHCGACGQKCNLPGSTDTYCASGTCKARACEEGTWYLHEDMCYASNMENCGGKGACTKDQVDGSETVICSGGVCKAETCQLGFYLNDGSCLRNDQDNCGELGVVCKKEDKAKAVEVSCNTALGTCEATVCEEGFYVYEGICEDNTDEHCGGHDQPCVAGDFSNAEVAQCDKASGKCKATACEPWYHVWQGACEKDDNVNCHEHDTPCTTDDVDGSSEVSCDTGKCVATKCKSDYLLSGDGCVKKNCDENTVICVETEGRGKLQKCTGNTWAEPHKDCNASCNEGKTDCGQCLNGTHRCNGLAQQTCEKGAWVTKNTCTTSVVGASAKCRETESGTTCGYECPEDRPTTCSGTCVNTNNDTNNCNKCGNTCNVANATNTCSSGTCSFSCNPNHCPSGNTCVSVNLSSDPNNCGWCGNKCPTPSGGTATCSGGTCSFSCNSGYCKSGNTCKSVNLSSDPNNCGTCGNTCSGLTSDCCGGTCVDLERDSNNCGYCGNRCTGSGASKKCLAGLCGGFIDRCRPPNVSCGGCCCLDESYCSNPQINCLCELVEDPI